MYEMFFTQWYSLPHHKNLTVNTKDKGPIDLLIPHITNPFFYSILCTITYNRGFKKKKLCALNTKDKRLIDLLMPQSAVDALWGIRRYETHIADKQ